MSAHFMAIVISLIVGGLAGYVVSGWLGALAVGFLIVLMFLIYHLIYINQLKSWLNNPKLSHIPHGMGLWADIFEHLMKQAKNRKKKQTKTCQCPIAFQSNRQSHAQWRDFIGRSGAYGMV